ncbi:MAG: hypothetical protein WBF04_07040 [Candidatus Sulfotelmatobacter sp.]
MNFLIPIEELRASQERYLARQAAARAQEFAAMLAACERAECAGVPPPFTYRARSPEQWEARAHRDPVKARILLEVAAEFPDATAKELAEASGMSTSWVRRTLKRAGMRAAKAVRQRKEVQP